MRRDLRGALIGRPADIAPRPRGHPLSTCGGSGGDSADHQAKPASIAPCSPRTPFKYPAGVAAGLRGALLGRPAGISPCSPRTPFKYLREIWRGLRGASQAKPTAAPGPLRAPAL